MRNGAGTARGGEEDSDEKRPSTAASRRSDSVSSSLHCVFCQLDRLRPKNRYLVRGGVCEERVRALGYTGELPGGPDGRMCGVCYKLITEKRQLPDVLRTADSSSRASERHEPTQHDSEEDEMNTASGREPPSLKRQLHSSHQHLGRPASRRRLDSTAAATSDLVAPEVEHEDEEVADVEQTLRACPFCNRAYHRRCRMPDADVMAALGYHGPLSDTHRCGSCAGRIRRGHLPPLLLATSSQQMPAAAALDGTEAVEAQRDDNDDDRTCALCDKQWVHNVWMYPTATADELERLGYDGCQASGRVRGGVECAARAIDEFARLTCPCLCSRTRQPAVTDTVEQTRGVRREEGRRRRQTTSESSRSRRAAQWTRATVTATAFLTSATSVTGTTDNTTPVSRRAN